MFKTLYSSLVQHSIIIISIQEIQAWTYYEFDYKFDRWKILLGGLFLNYFTLFQHIPLFNNNVYI